MKPLTGALSLLAGIGATAYGEAAETGFYIGAEVALVAPTVDKSAGVTFARPPDFVRVLPESVQYEETLPGWNAVIGYRFGPHFAAEFAYADFGSIDVEETFDLSDIFPFPNGSDEFTTDFNLKVTGPMASVMGILPFSERFEAFGRAGVLWARQEAEFGPRFSFNDAEERWALGLGLQTRLGGGWSARLEYQRLEDIEGTPVSGDLRLERFLLGATYDLGTRGSALRDAGTHPDADDTGFYAVADLGITESAVGKSGGFLLSFSHVPGAIIQARPTTASADGSDTGYSLTLGYRINRHVAAELAYIDFGNVDIREHYVIGPLDDPFFLPQFNIDLELELRVRGPSLSVLGILPISNGFELFGRAGVLFADQNASSSPESASANADELWIWGAGFDVDLARGWSVRFAYENLEELQRTVHTGPIRMERFVFGARYDF